MSAVPHPVTRHPWYSGWLRRSMQRHEAMERLRTQRHSHYSCCPCALAAEIRAAAVSA